MLKICTTEDCERPVNAKGLCQMHYRRARRSEKVTTVSEAKSRLEELRAMRVVLARAIDAPETPARELSPLVRRLQELSVDIESLEAIEAEQRETDATRSLIDSAFDLSDI